MFKYLLTIYQQMMLFWRAMVSISSSVPLPSKRPQTPACLEVRDHLVSELTISWRPSSTIVSRWEDNQDFERRRALGNFGKLTIFSVSMLFFYNYLARQSV